MRRKETLTRYISPSGKHGCLHCWECVDACPKGVLDVVKILWHKHVKVVDADACIGCGKCVKACPKGLLTLTPQSRV